MDIEFQPNQAKCFENKTVCNSRECVFQLLDLTFCIHESNQNAQNRLNYSKSDVYNVTLKAVAEEQDIPFSRACRKCFLESGNCSLNLVPPATLRIKPLDIFFAALSCTFDVYGVWHIFSYRVHATAYFGSTFWLLMACPITSIAVALFKLFPVQYRCETFSCRTLVHNAILSLAVFLFEILEIYFEYIVENYKARKKMEGNVLSKNRTVEASLVHEKSLLEGNEDLPDACDKKDFEREMGPFPTIFEKLDSEDRSCHTTHQDVASTNQVTSLPQKLAQPSESTVDQYSPDDLIYLELRKSENTGSASTCTRILEKFRKLNKACGLLSSTLWLVKDFSDFARMSPGPGTLAIGMVAIAASFLLLLGQFWAERHVFSCLCDLSGLKPPPQLPSETDEAAAATADTAAATADAAAASAAGGAVKEVRGRAGQFLDCVEFVLASGEASLYGHVGGGAVEPSLVLGPAEHVRTVRWKPGGHYAGCGIDFRTSSGREYRCRGSAYAASSEAALEWSAPPGEMVVGLRVEAGRNSWQEITLVRGIVTSPLA
jgi:hypothetical protein